MTKALKTKDEKPKKTNLTHSELRGRRMLKNTLTLLSRHRFEDLQRNKDSGRERDYELSQINREAKD